MSRGGRGSREVGVMAGRNKHSIEKCNKQKKDNVTWRVT